MKLGEIDVYIIKLPIPHRLLTHAVTTTLSDSDRAMRDENREIFDVRNEWFLHMIGGRPRGYD